MVRNPEETIGKIIDKASTSFIAYVDDNGYPITKAMLKPRERNGIKTIWQDGDIMYYKEGVTDPDYCGLKFTSVKGRYYSNFKSEDFEV